jgi:hypothetical protein
MKAKQKPVIEQAADKVNDAVEEITFKAADAVVEPDVEHVAGTTNEQVYIPKAIENVSLPSHIDPKSDDRIARERQKYVEQIVGLAAARQRSARFDEKRL